MTSRDDLRAVAAEIRQLARDATPGPWDVTAQSVRYGGLVSPSQPHDGGYGGKLIGESMSLPNRRHVAAWHPAVALAVADWLEAEAGSRDGPIGYALAFVEAWRADA